HQLEPDRGRGLGAPVRCERLGVPEHDPVPPGPRGQCGAGAGARAPGDRLMLAFPPVGTRLVAATEITIAASTWRWDGNSGSVRVSSGVAMKPGYCSAANLNTYRVFVAGVEQAIAAHPLDGTFPDGSYRSILTQFLYTLTHNLPVESEIRLNQGPRGTTDIAFVEPTLADIVSKKAVIAPTDPAYLCAT